MSYNWVTKNSGGERKQEEMKGKKCENEKFNNESFDKQ